MGGNRGVRLYRNERGTGKTSTTMPVPQAASGSGRSATPFDHEGNGTTDLVVVHGHDGAGPIRLLSFPRP